MSKSSKFPPLGTLKEVRTTMKYGKHKQERILVLKRVNKWTYRGGKTTKIRWEIVANRPADPEQGSLSSMEGI